MSVRTYDWLSCHADRTPDKTAWVDLHSNRSFTYAQANDRAARLGAYLQSKCGIKKGDRIGVLAMNSTDMFEVQFACAKIGAVYLPLNWRLTVTELTFIIEDAGPAAFVFDRAFAAEVAELQDLIDLPHCVETTGGGGDTPYEAAIASAGAEPEAVELSHDDTWTIMYTSGTTGLPKGAVNTYRMTFYNAVNLAMSTYITAGSVALAILPLFHTGGLNCYASVVLHTGGTVLVARAFEPGEMLRLIGDAEVGVTHFFGVPANYLFMSQHPDFATIDFSRLVAAGIGGAPTPIPLLETYEGVGVALQQGYGMTETSPLVFAHDREMALSKPGSCGKLALHAEARIVREDGTDAEVDENGELWVRGPNITPGYWNRAEANEESFTDGWFHTGDACRIDADGHYYIVDRWKDMYISGGENVYPAEVESVLFKLEQLADVAVIGVPDEKWGEIGCAVAVAQEGSDLTVDDIIEHCHGKLAKFKIPRQLVFMDELPRNATGKVLKRVLREQVLGT